MATEQGRTNAIEGTLSSDWGIHYLTVEIVAAIHHDVMKKTGSPNIVLAREAQLDSALARPMYAACCEDASLIRQAAILAYAISQAQAFADGNKRTALQASMMFLRINGARYRGDPDEYGRKLEDLAERRHNGMTDREAFDELAAWLESRVILA